MSRPSPVVKKRYNDATMRITFSLNKSETELVKEIFKIPGLIQKDANRKAKDLFLQYIKPSE